MNELTYVINSILGDLRKTLDNAGIYYRIFARQKSTGSIVKKLNGKAEKYRRSNTKMQDIIGVRIVFYFMDDVEIINDYLHRQTAFLGDSDSQDDIRRMSREVTGITNLDDKIFMPTRLNLVFRMDRVHAEELKKELKNA